eukprot:5204234-Pyramimonas_sp.AAC.2
MAMFCGALLQYTRGYSEKKLQENMECEIMQVVLEEARESYKCVLRQLLYALLIPVKVVLIKTKQCVSNEHSVGRNVFIHINGLGSNHE